MSVVSYFFLSSSQAGHRAEIWNVDNWIAEVTVKIVRFSNDEASIILSDHSAATDPALQTAGELFAECPVSRPLFTCVEPVIDSSRYFVIRVVDRESGRHVFLGLGFREREEASNFNAALAEHQSYLERKEAAASMRKAFDDAYKEQEDAGEAANNNNNSTSAAEDAGNAAAAAVALRQPMVDYSLKPGEKLHLKLGGNGNNGSSISRNGTGFLSTKLTKTFSLMFDPENRGATMAALAPQPPLSRTRLMKPTMDITPRHSAGKTVEWGEFETAEQEVTQK
jgi:adaptin ear-binding coat-associated protein 1/2